MTSSSILRAVATLLNALADVSAQPACLHCQNVAPCTPTPSRAAADVAAALATPAGSPTSSSSSPTSLSLTGSVPTQSPPRTLSPLASTELTTATPAVMRAVRSCFTQTWRPSQQTPSTSTRFTQTWRRPRRAATPRAPTPLESDTHGHGQSGQGPEGVVPAEPPERPADDPEQMLKHTFGENKCVATTTAGSQTVATPPCTPAECTRPASPSRQISSPGLAQHSPSDESNVEVPSDETDVKSPRTRFLLAAENEEVVTRRSQRALKKHKRKLNDLKTNPPDSSHVKPKQPAQSSTRGRVQRAVYQPLRPPPGASLPPRPPWLAEEVAVEKVQRMVRAEEQARDRLEREQRHARAVCCARNAPPRVHVKPEPEVTDKQKRKHKKRKKKHKKHSDTTNSASSDIDWPCIVWDPTPLRSIFPDITNPAEVAECHLLLDQVHAHPGGEVAYFLNDVELSIPNAARTLAARHNCAARLAWAAIRGVGEAEDPYEDP